jgi:hypothetical protein
VLLRFREKQFAITADIEAMFLQIGVQEQHRDVLRFLFWKEGKPGSEVITYRIKQNLFGGTWSSAAANWALKRTGKEFEKQYSTETLNALDHSFYVDDMLHSCATKEEAIETGKQVQHLLQRRGFNLTKFSSNDKEIIQAFEPKDRAKGLQNLDLQECEMPIDRALGLTWDSNSDRLQIAAKSKDAVFTKRGLLSYICTLYDPLGIICPYILIAKNLFQQLCKRKAGWDDLLDQKEAKVFKNWLNVLNLAREIGIDRPLPTGRTAEIHHFCDASDMAYGAVSYLRIVENETVHVSFLFAKSRLAPLKKMTIPRLELTSAVLAAKHDGMLRKEMKIMISSSTFWTNSMITLHCINNHDKRFNVFVANRIAAIHEASQTDQWHWCPTKDNPADDASRGLKPDELNGRWLNGPPFLQELKIIYPSPEKSEELPQDLEEPTNLQATNKDQPKCEQLIHRYSSFYRLSRAVAFLRRFIDYVKGSRMKSKITVEEIDAAKIAIIRSVQQTTYHAEIEALQKGKFISKSSAVFKLEPWIDENGMLRVSARSAKHVKQLLLPAKHHLTKLIVRDYHEQSKHSGCEYVLSQLRQMFWIPSARNMIKAVQRSCKICIRYFSKPQDQRMADLVEDQLASDKTPFESTGVDCFGPFLVKRGRSMEKRYGCIFTCLTMRAVHLELLHSMEADSFLNALMRFSARRGAPKKIRCDNGTNFKGACNEMKTSIEEFNMKVDQQLKQQNIEWNFNTPTASYQGGAWERMIRAARRTLTVVIGKTILDDERLLTVFCEVEAILNNRPITKNADDVLDEEPLTPNHLLLMRKGSLNLPGTFKQRDEYSRRWRHCQYIADRFWARWLKEYLPIIQHRQKWLKPQRSFACGDIVLLYDETTPRNQWPLGRIIEVDKGRDGNVRSATVKTSAGTYKRPVSKLCLLESSM